MSDEHLEERRPSKSAKKRAAKAVEEMARQLVELAEAQWQKLPASDEIREEVEMARQTKGHGARKRQLKHLAGELRRREEQLPDLQDFLEGLSQSQLGEKKAFHHLEELRDRLCDSERSAAALEEIEKNWPSVDGPALVRLARSAQENRDRRAFREIFRRLKDASENND